MTPDGSKFFKKMTPDHSWRDQGSLFYNSKVPYGAIFFFQFLRFFFSKKMTPNGSMESFEMTPDHGAKWLHMAPNDSIPVFTFNLYIQVKSNNKMTPIFFDSKWLHLVTPNGSKNSKSGVMESQFFSISWFQFKNFRGSNSSVFVVPIPRFSWLQMEPQPG